MHVDAYRLGSAAELDDLDIDFDGSVVIVEWGRGMVDGIRDTGGRSSSSASGTGADRTTPATASRTTAELDADAPRLVRIARHP